MPAIAPRWVAVRTAGEGAPGDLLGLVAAAFAEVDPSVRVVGGTTVGERMAAPLARPRLALAVLGALAAIVLLLAAVGTYGAVAASVRGRTLEMGVRMACGATAGDVGGLILREALALAAAGVIAGAAAAVACGRFVESLLYGVGARDPRALAVAAAVVLATTLAACLAPAWRAARTDPREALKSEG
jgi:putative ABC transport system permease protein